MKAQTYQRGVTRFLAVHFVISIFLTAIIATDTLGGWLVFSFFSYAFAWIVIPFLYAGFIYSWPEIHSSFFIPRFALAFFSCITITGFCLLLDSHFMHLQLQFFTTLAAGLSAAFINKTV